MEGGGGGAVTGQTNKTAWGGGGENCAWIFSRITHYHKGSLGLSHTGILCFEVAHIMNLNFLLMYFVESYRCMNFKLGKFV